MMLLMALALASVDVPDPVSGMETRIVVTHGDGVPSPGETVRVVHRPGLLGEREFAIGITDGLGRVRWSPELSGVARVTAGEESVFVVVGTTGPPWSSLLASLLLAAAAAGALVFGLRRRTA